MLGSGPTATCASVQRAAALAPSLPGLMCAGRADVLGLAISLVAAVPEKVWFCTRKGYSPWERPKREDVGTHDQGGHTIWYNEAQLMQAGPSLQVLQRRGL